MNDRHIAAFKESKEDLSAFLKTFFRVDQSVEFTASMTSKIV